MQGNHTTNDNDMQKTCGFACKDGFCVANGGVDLLFGRVRGRNQSPASIFK